jgi:ATP synthase protein I
LSDLGYRLTRMRRVRAAPGQDARRGTQLGLAFRLATELVAGFVVGGFIGWWLDRWLGTLPLFLLAFFGLGAAAGIVNVVRTARSMNAAAGDDQAGAGGEPPRES